MRKKIKFAETFVGCGGSHVGFKELGFEDTFANDNNSIFLESLKANNHKNNLLIIDSPIEALAKKDILKISGLDKGELDLLFGGVVCKGFSLAGVRNPNDPRNTLYLEQLKLARKLMPKFSIIENVPGMSNLMITSSKTPKKIKAQADEVWKFIDKYKGIKADLTKNNQTFTKKELLLIGDMKKKKKELEEFIQSTAISVVDDLEDRYDKMGYYFFKDKLKAHHYGAATTRERLILVAVRKDLKIKDFIYPEPTHGAGLIPYKTVNDALQSLDIKGINNPKNDLDNQPMNHKEKSIRRFKLIPEGKNIVDVLDSVPEDLKVSGFYSRGCTMRLDGSKPSPTLVPGHSNFPVHPKKHRSITVREAAAITGFPNEYKFIGSHTQRCEQVGQAVAPPLSNAIGRRIKEYLL
jgi:DNA (cytosine-5)-methyltransferase 1